MDPVRLRRRDRPRPEDPVRDPERSRHHPRRVPQCLGHQRAGPDRRADRRGRGAPGRARPLRVVHRLTDRQDQYRGRLRRPPRPGAAGPGRRPAPRRPVHPDLLVLPAPRPGAGAVPRRGDPTDDRARREGRAHRHRAAARERDGHLRRRPGPRARHRRVGRLPRPAPGLGSRQLRAGGRHPVHRRLRQAPPAHRLRPDQGRAARHRRRRSRGRGRRSGPRDRARAGRRRLRRLLLHEPHLGTYNEYGALSGPANFTRATRAFTAILDSEGITYS